jgi:hypothetical protein
MFHIPVYLASKLCPAVLETVDLPALAWYPRKLSALNICSSCQNGTAGYASVANIVRRDVKVFASKTVFNLIQIFIDT